MGNRILDFLYLGSTVVTELAQRRGAKLLSVNKEVLIDLTKGSKPYKQKIASCFCAKAAHPQMAIRYQGSDSVNSASIRFLDGNTPLSNGSFSKSKSGHVSFDFSIVNSKQTRHLSVNGSYNPNEKFFDWDNCGETLEHRQGRTIAQIDSSGFSIRTDVDDNSALKILHNVKSGIKEVLNA